MCQVHVIMYSGFDITYNVEFYPGVHIDPEAGVSRLRIKGKRFAREIYRSLEGHEDITAQFNYNDASDFLYEVDQPLHCNAMDRGDTLLQAIIEDAPNCRAYLAESQEHTN